MLPLNTYNTYMHISIHAHICTGRFTDGVRAGGTALGHVLDLCAGTRGVRALGRTQGPVMGLQASKQAVVGEAQAAGWWRGGARDESEPGRRFLDEVVILQGAAEEVCGRGYCGGRSLQGLRGALRGSIWSGLQECRGGGKEWCTGFSAKARG